MRAQDVGGGSSGGRRPRWLLHVVALLVLGVLVTVGGLPSPGLRLASTTDPVPPTNVTATAADRALAISWTASTESFISGYKVYLDGVLAASPTGTSATVTGLVNGRGYVVTVRTVTTLVGTSEGTTASEPVTGTPRDAVLPAAPTGVTAVRGDGQVAVSWVANSGDYDADGYRVLRGGTPVTGLLAGRGTTGWTDTTVPATTAAAYAEALARLDSALVLWRRAAVAGGRGRVSRNPKAYACGCGRRIRVTENTMAEGPILCGLCEGEFQCDP